MDNELRSIINKLGREVRRWALNQGAHPSLGEWCAICSGELAKRLEEHGIKPEVRISVDGDNNAHVFLALDDHIIDITATQFVEYRDRPVVIMHEREATEWYHEAVDFVPHYKMLKKYQKKNGWVKEQIAWV